MLTSRYLIYNKKRTFIMVLSVTLAVTLLLSIGLLFSSIHGYMVNESMKEKPYHVYFESGDFEKPSFVSKKVYKDGTIYIKYKNVFDTYKNTKRICKVVKCRHITYNERLFSLYGIGKNKNMMDTFKVLLITVLSILGVAVMVLISNAFRISLFERKKQIGILKSVGMTRVRIILMILGEASIILIFGLMFGIIISMWLVEALLVSINYLLADIFETKIILSIYPLFVLISILFIIVIYYVSCLMPAFKMSKISVIEAIRENDNFNRKKIPWYAYRFKVVNRLAFSNYYRVKSKYRAIKLCVFISSMLYISFSLYLSYGISGIDSYVSIPNYDFYVSALGSDKNYNSLEDFGKRYDKYKLYKTCSLDGSIDKDSYIYENDYSDKKKVMVVQSKSEGVINYIKEEGKKDRKYLKNKVHLNINGGVNVRTIYDKPFGLESLLGKDNIVLLTNDFDKYCDGYNLDLYIKGDSKKIIKGLGKLKLDGDVNYVDVGKAIRLTKNFVLALKVSLYSILVLVVIIGITLVSSTFSVNLNLRIKEIGILKSVGMTNRQLKRLLFTESMIVLFKTFIFIIPFSLFISYVLYESINGTIDMDMIMPSKEIIISFMASLFIVYYSLSSNYKRIKKNQIIKMITSNNV